MTLNEVSQWDPRLRIASENPSLTLRVMKEAREPTGTAIAIQDFVRKVYREWTDPMRKHLRFKPAHIAAGVDNHCHKFVLDSLADNECVVVRGKIRD